MEEWDVTGIAKAIKNNYKFNELIKLFADNKFTAE